MTDAWDRFIDGFGEKSDASERRAGEDPIWEQLDALHDERAERHDPRWFPPGPDPQGLERLVEERRRRGKLRARP
jgi:hypothetical protein